MSPLPDQVILITDGLPTMGKIGGLQQAHRCGQARRLFDDAVGELPEKVPVDVVLMPMKATCRRPIASGGSRASPTARCSCRRRTGHEAASSHRRDLQPVVPRLHLLRLRRDHPAARADGGTASRSRSRRVASKLNGQVKLLDEQLHEIRGETELLNRELKVRLEELQKEDAPRAARRRSSRT